MSAQLLISSKASALIVDYGVLKMIKKHIENALRGYPSLFRFGSRVYHRFNGSFRTLSSGTPQAIFEAFELAKEYAGDKPVGDYYEFGLFRGYTFLQAYKHCQSLQIDGPHFYGFDSFEGLPAPANETDAVDNRFFEGQFACSMDSVKDNLKTNGMDFSKMTLVKGFYNESLTESLRTEHTFKKASVVLLDCDYYSSTMDALNWMLPYLEHHTVLLFDDWYSYSDDKELGQQKALKEFLTAHPHFDVEPLDDFKDHGKGFVLVNK